MWWRRRKLLRFRNELCGFESRLPSGSGLIGKTLTFLSQHIPTFLFFAVATIQLLLNQTGSREFESHHDVDNINHVVQLGERRS